MTATIERVDLFPVRLPMIKSFTFASGSAGVAGGKAPHLFLKMTDSEGRVAWGEGRPVPAWSYETLETVTLTIRHQLAPAIIGMPITDRRAIQQRMHQAIGRGPSTGQPIAKAAVDIAVHDLCAQAAGMTLRSFLGGQDGRNRVELSYTLTGHDRGFDHRGDGRGDREPAFRHFNFKAAVDPATDIEVAETVRERIPEGGFVWADANQGFLLNKARTVARAFEQIGVDLLEQPLPADQIHLMRALRTQTCHRTGRR